MDGSTDKGNVEDELIVITKDNVAEEVGTHARFFSLQEPKKADADGLIQCLGGALRMLGIANYLRRSPWSCTTDHDMISNFVDAILRCFVKVEMASCNR